MRKVMLGAVMVVASLFFANQIVYSAPPGKHAHEKAGHACAKRAGVHRGGYIHSYIGMYKKHAKELGLSPEQQEKLAALDAECTESCNKVGEQIAAAETELDKLIQADALGMDAVSAKIKEVHELKAKLELAHFESLAKAQQILSPEQREKCRKLCEKKVGKEWPMVH